MTDTATQWAAYRRAATALAGTDREALDDAVCELVHAERSAVVGQLHIVAQRPDAGPIDCDVVRAVSLTA